jgi:hypothetical protein
VEILISPDSLPEESEDFQLKLTTRAPLDGLIIPDCATVTILDHSRKQEYVNGTITAQASYTHGLCMREGTGYHVGRRQLLQCLS